MDLQNSYFILNESFRDYDKFAHTTQQWNLDFRQMDKGRFIADVLQLGSSEGLISEAEFNRKLDQRGRTPEGFRTFAVFKDCSTPAIWRGQEVTKNDLTVFPSDGEIDACSFPGFNVITMSFKEDLVVEVGNTVGIGEISSIIRNPVVVNGDPAKLSALRNRLSQLSGSLRNNPPQMTVSQILYEIEYEIPRALILTLITENAKQRTPNPTNRYRAIRRVKEYLEAFTYDDITVRDLCKAAGVSERTLQYAFMEYSGISPKTFVKMNRLNHVRRELRNTYPSYKSISDIANRWGFWHMGQFAADYKKLFGELPSETKRG